MGIRLKNKNLFTTTYSEISNQRFDIYDRGIK